MTSAATTAPLAPTKAHDTIVGMPESVEAQLAFERKLADISARFAAVPLDAVERQIADALGELIQFMGTDRSTFAEIHPDGRVDALCSTAAEGIEPQPLGPLNEQAPWVCRQNAAGITLVFPDLPEGLPTDEAAREITYAARTGMRAFLGIPLRVAGEVRFAIMTGAFRRTRHWSEDFVARLKLVGEVFAQALARSRSEMRLRSALAEVSALKERLEAENVYLREAVPAAPGRDALPSHSPAFRRVVEEAAQVAATRTTVLLLGETGTGKELMAGYIHGESPRRERTMIKLNCAALPASLIEAELFGREKGAYTGALTRQVGRFELADGSTIFLDEVGELPYELQAKLLRVLQEGEFERVGGTQTIKVDVRVIAATNRPLEDDVRAGRFREDLYYRLNVFPIRLPPLRERPADIPMLVWQFTREIGQSVGKSIDRIPETTMLALQAYGWPGNIRELRNVIERAMILSRDGSLQVTLPDSRPPAASVQVNGDGERAEIESILARCGWRIRGAGGAAERLGMKPTTLESRMKKLGIARPR